MRPWLQSIVVVLFVLDYLVKKRDSTLFENLVGELFRERWKRSLEQVILIAFALH
jgi:hypothetical protein